MTSSFRAMEVKVKTVLKTQCEQRQKLYQDYSLQVTNLNRKLTTDANQVKKHAEKLSNMFTEQEKFIHESLTLQKNRMEEFKSLCEEYLEKYEVLKDSWGNSITEELRRLIATLERKCLTLHRASKRLLLLHSLSWIRYSHNTLEGKSRYEGSRKKLGEATCGDVCSFGDYIFSWPPPVPEDAPFC